ncbi:MAG: threonine--tRNA ligase [Candidatus Woesearchaeota archaeon]|jgi:threonyl-tRNA synthetase
MEHKEHKITLIYPDGTKKEQHVGITGEEIAKSISEGLARKSVCIKIDDALYDLSTPIMKSGEIKIITLTDPEGKNTYQHSTAHVMAQAITRLFPEAKLTIGPVVDDGFYYDIDHAPFNPADLEKIEEEMKKIVKEDLTFKRIELSTKDALKLFQNNSYKQEIIKNIEEFGEGKTEKSETVSIYTQGDFSDLCRGPHLPRTGMIKAFKLTKLAGAYWRGDSKNKQLQRIYGVSFPEKKELDTYLKNIEEAEKRDHRKIGKQLELFMFDDVSPGSAFFYPKGTTIYLELMNFLRKEYRKRGYFEVITPLIYDKSLWETSGHWEFYKENMFLLNVDGREFSLKPMNCPSHALMFKSNTKSYRDLPWRVADFAPLHRNELKGVLGGLTRVRRFSQDDAHIFCTEDQMEKEIIDLLSFTKYIYTEVFNFEYEVMLSTRPEKFMGQIDLWNKAEAALINALEKSNITFKLNEGDGAFYGPKVDIMIKDALGRMWQCPTIQVDFQMPLKFEATYEGEDGRKHTPVMIHRALLGSLERFIGILIEDCAGKFPLWLSPIQVRLLTIADRHNTYADVIYEKLTDAGIRVEKDYKSDTINKKVRNAQLDQINYIAVIGDKESESNTLNIRTRDNVVHGEKNVDSFLNELLDEVKNKKK